MVSSYGVYSDNLPLGDNHLPQGYVQNKLKYITLYCFMLLTNTTTIIITKTFKLLHSYKNGKGKIFSIKNVLNSVFCTHLSDDSMEGSISTEWSFY